MGGRIVKLFYGLGGRIVNSGSVGKLGVIRPLVEGLLVLVVGFKSLPLFGLDDAP